MKKDEEARKKLDGGKQSLFPGTEGKLGLDSTMIVDWIMGGQRRW